MGLINSNIRYLRKQKGLTQEALAKELEVSRSVIGAYEEDRAEPKLITMQKIANFFGISLDQLASVDLAELAARSIAAQSMQGSRVKLREEVTRSPSPASTGDPEGENLRVLSITVDSQDRENIELVPDKAAAGYLNGYADPEYIEELSKFQLPMLPQGTYRAFEISGDSMLPLASGSIIIGEYVENWKEIRSGQTYVLVTGSEGIVYKRVYNHIAESGKLTLRSDNPTYPPYDVEAGDVMEVWRAKAYISLDFPDAEISLQKLAGIVLDLQQEVIRMKK